LVGGHEVLWWDPHHLEIETATKPGLRRYWILQARPGEGPTSGERAYHAWSERVASLVQQGSAESYHATSVTRLVEQEDVAHEGSDGVELVEVPGRDPQRPGGKRFGSLVHELLARSEWLRDDPEAVTVEPLSRSLMRMLDATETERKAAVESVVQALKHPIFAEAKRAPECYRETPLIHRTAEGHLIEGIPDLVFRLSPDEPWTIVDFKTDLRLDMSAEPYRRQVAHYIEALEAATTAKAKGILLYV
jgi:ATP-dependent helicase/nuclease subunit A